MGLKVGKGEEHHDGVRLCIRASEARGEVLQAVNKMSCERKRF